MKAQEELNDNGIYNCPECNCPTGNDWEYKDYSNKTIIVCPQCKENIYTEDIYTTEKLTEIQIADLKCSCGDSADYMCDCGCLCCGQDQCEYDCDGSVLPITIQLNKGIKPRNKGE